MPKYTAPPLKITPEGFTKSFSVDHPNKQELSDYYHTYGFVIFDGVINQQEVELTINDLWASTKKYYKEIRNVNIDRDDPKTWNQLRGFQKAYGFVNDSILEEPQIWENRRNPNVYHAFKKVYQAQTGKPLQQPLIASFDRGSLMLPSKINPKWRTVDIYHFDIDPWVWTGLKENHYQPFSYDPNAIQWMLGEGNYTPFVGYTKLAGVLALSDTNQTSGGFSCAPGFQNYIKQWCIQHKKPISIEKDKNLVSNFANIFMKKGSLLVFSRQLPHNIYQNDSKEFRYAQYLRMSPLSALCLSPQQMQARKKMIKMILPPKWDLSDSITRQIFMLHQQDVQERKKVILDKALIQENNQQKKALKKQQTQPGST